MSLLKNSQFRPFLWSALIWLIIGLVLVSLISSPQGRGSAGAWFFLFWLLGVADLSTIAALVFSIVYWEGAPDKARLGLRMGLLGILKVALLLIFGGILFLRHGIPTSSLLVGLGTLIVVPIFGGLAWSFQAKTGGAN